MWHSQQHQAFSGIGGWGLFRADPVARGLRPRPGLRPPPPPSPQTDLKENKEEIKTITDSKGTRAKLSAAQENVLKLKKQVQGLRSSGAYGTMEFK